MGYTFGERGKRIMNRSDMSTYLTHLTKPKDNLSALDVLIKILNEKKLIGTSKEAFVTGNDSVVCFQDVPLYSVSQNAFYEGVEWAEDFKTYSFKKNARYAPAGLLFSKSFIWNTGGRPVIYEDKRYFLSKLDPSEHWRVVQMDLSNPNDIKDFTHEREWRVKTNELPFEYGNVHVLLDDQNSYKYFIKNVDKSVLENIKGFVMLTPVIF